VDLRKEVSKMTARKLDIKDYCDSLYNELFEMKSRLSGFITMIEQGEDRNRELLDPYVRHLHETIGFIDWKLEIFNKVCPVNWGKYTEGVESTVSVPPMEPFKEGDQPSAGDFGG
jgi:hypothetical protein